MGIKHHSKRIRRIHVGYCLGALNAIALVGLLTYGFTVRAVQAEVDTATLHAMMDSDAAVPFMLQPPEVK